MIKLSYKENLIVFDRINLLYDSPLNKLGPMRATNELDVKSELGYHLSVVYGLRYCVSINLIKNILSPQYNPAF